jgi:hypothetical protein
MALRKPRSALGKTTILEGDHDTIDDEAKSTRKGCFVHGLEKSRPCARRGEGGGPDSPEEYHLESEKSIEL